MINLLTKLFERNSLWNRELRKLTVLTFYDRREDGKEGCLVKKYNGNIDLTIGELVHIQDFGLDQPYVRNGFYRIFGNNPLYKNYSSPTSLVFGSQCDQLIKQYYLLRKNRGLKIGTIRKKN